MALTYPLTPPAALKTAIAQWTAKSSVAINSSTYTAQQQVLANSGEWWEVSLEVPATTSRATADEIDAFLLGLRGRYGTFRYGDKLRTAPRGSVTGTYQVFEWLAGQTVLQSLGAGLKFQKGDFLQIENQLVRVTFVHDDNALEVFPRARKNYAYPNITYANPTGIFRLMEDPIIPLNRGKVFGPYNLNLIESVTST